MHIPPIKLYNKSNVTRSTSPVPIAGSRQQEETHTMKHAQTIQKVPLMRWFVGIGLGLSAGWIIVMLVYMIPRAQAATLQVSTLADNGPGSLRQIIANANAGDTITFAVQGILTLTSGPITITTDLTINGPGAADLIISGNTITRVLQIAPDSEVTLRGLTVRDGWCPDDGGGISNAGKLTISNSIIMTNTAEGNGGGIFNHPQAHLIIENTSILSNTTVDGSGSGLYNTGVMTTSNALISHNRAKNFLIRRGGGLYNAGVWTMDASTIHNNESDIGGGMSNTGTMTITASTIERNTAISAAGIINSGTLNLIASTVSGNTVVESGWGIENTQSGLLNILNSTVSSNEGGGVLNSGTVNLTGATISNNRIQGEGGGIANQGGSVVIRNTIIAGNYASVADADCGGRNVLISQGYNLLGESCPLTDVETDKQIQDPQLSFLMDNGGSTLTQMPLLGSPALDALPLSRCVVATDQRGIIRPQGGDCDIGAVEVTAPMPAVAISNMTLSDHTTGDFPNSNAPLNLKVCQPGVLLVEIMNRGIQPFAGGGYTLTWTLHEGDEVIEQAVLPASAITLLPGVQPGQRSPQTAISTPGFFHTLQNGELTITFTPTAALQPPFPVNPAPRRITVTDAADSETCARTYVQGAVNIRTRGILESNHLIGNVIATNLSVPLLVTNSAGQRTGFLGDAQTLQEIPGGRAIQVGDQRAVVYPGEAPATVQVSATITSTLDFYAGLIQPDDHAKLVIHATVPITPGLRATFNTADSAATLQIDVNGDSQIDQVRLPDQVDPISTTLRWIYLPLMRR